MASDSFITCKELYQHVLRHPNFRVVKAVSENKDVCTPLKFVPGGEELCFEVDLSYTAMHPHAFCSELIDLLGEELPEELEEQPVLFLDIGDRNRKDAKKTIRISLDVDAKWLKLHIAE